MQFKTVVKTTSKNRTKRDSKLSISRQKPKTQRSYSKRKPTCTFELTNTNPLGILTPLDINIYRGEVFITDEKSFQDIDIIKAINDLYPKVKNYIKRYENTLTNEDYNPYLFFKWMITSIDNWLNGTDKEYVLYYSELENEYQIILFTKEDTLVKGHSADIIWIEKCPSKVKKLLYSILHHLQNLGTPFYFYNENSLIDEIDNCLEMMESECEYDDDEGIVEQYESMKHKYEVESLEMASKIIKGCYSLDKLQHYANSNDDIFSEIIKDLVYIINEDFSLNNYSENIITNEYIDVNDYITYLPDYMSIVYDANGHCPVWQMLEQQFQERTNSGIETPSINKVFNGNNFEENDEQKFKPLKAYLNILSNLCKLSETYDK